MTAIKLKLKPHHALCLLLFDPQGHSEPYSKIMHSLIDVLDSGQTHEIALLPGSELDIICEYCPHNDSGICEKSDEVRATGRKVLRLCGLNYGDIIAWESLRAEIIDKVITAGKISEVCEGCFYAVQCEAVGSSLKKGGFLT